MEKLTLSEFQSRYGRSTERRQELMERFVQWAVGARSVGVLGRIWVYGSFLSDKPGPEDMDIFAHITAPDLGNLPQRLHQYIEEPWPGLHFSFVASGTPSDTVDSILDWLREGRTKPGTALEVVA